MRGISHQEAEEESIKTFGQRDNEASQPSEKKTCNAKQAKGRPTKGSHKCVKKSQSLTVLLSTEAYINKAILQYKRDTQAGQSSTERKSQN